MKWTPKKIEKLKECAEKGMTIEAVIEAMGVSFVEIHHIAYQYDLHFKSSKYADHASCCGCMPNPWEVRGRLKKMVPGLFGAYVEPSAKDARHGNRKN